MGSLGTQHLSDLSRALVNDRNTISHKMDPADRCQIKCDNDRHG